MRESEILHDVFVSYSSKDVEVVTEIAIVLRDAGLRVWIDCWNISPGDNIPVKIEEGLNHSQILLLCMSANSFGSDWTQLEGYTFRFRDPLNKQRRLVPLLLEDFPVQGSLGQLKYIDWRPEIRKNSFEILLRACGAAAPETVESLPNNAARITSLMSALSDNCTKARALQIENEFYYLVKNDIDQYLALANQYTAPAREAVAVVGGRLLHSGINNQSIVDLLRKLSQDPDKWVRKKANDALWLTGLR